MGRFYYGDIEGKFAFGIQSSYDPEEFGTKALELYRWTCGCSSEKGKPSDCDCIVEHVHNYDPENGPVCDGPDSPNGPCLKTEDENIQDTDFKTLKFNFDDSMLDYIEEQLQNIENSYDPTIKEKYLEYMNGENDRKTAQELADYLNTTIQNLQIQAKLFYRYELGKEIHDYLLEHGTCTFRGDV